MGAVSAQDETHVEPVLYGVDDGSMPSMFTPYYEDKERGWFWYEEPPAKEDGSIEKQAVPAPQKPPEPKPQGKAATAKPLSSEWFRKNMEKIRDKAIDDPSPENVTAYMYLQRVMLDKAERFASATQVAVMSDSLLDENSRRPIATFGSFAKDEMAARGTEKAAKKLAQSAGLWFFYASDCVYCLKESGVLKGLMNTYGFTVLPISLDGLPLPNGDFPNFTNDQGQAKKIGVDTTPALFLVKPGVEGGIIQLGQGLLSAEEIVNRAITLTYGQGWLSNDEYKDTRKVKPLGVDKKTINGVDEKTMDKPGELIEVIRNNLKKQL
jgi:conjugal transfer pilus assembly protein TraF